MRSRPALAVAVAATAVIVLTACSSSGDDTSAAPGAGSASPIGGMTTCDTEALTEPATAAVTADSPDLKLDQIDEVQCADGWAAVLADVSGDDGSDGYAITLVFEAEGQFWIPKDRGDVCGTPSTDDPAARPADAQVPEAIWAVACNSN